MYKDIRCCILFGNKRKFDEVCGKKYKKCGGIDGDCTGKDLQHWAGFTLFKNLPELCEKA